MLKLKDIKKHYRNVHALKGISVSFRNKEFVSILGPSGCGKTTLLNIIGGLDRYSSGDLTIANQSTRTYKDKDWDAYRNSTIGFVFQSYNLIPHLTIVQNVALSTKLSGVSEKESRLRAEMALTKVGLQDQFLKKPNQLSGGQMQRVAIARALVNDPDIILADEPTGALDSQTSVVIMDILREIAKEKLVIMVTHNAQLADQYSTRTIELLDGSIVSDTHPLENQADEDVVGRPKGTAMSYKTALSLSGRNLLAKKGRTILISFAGSIGIIGIALVLALSSGISASINSMETNTLASSPITIEPTQDDMLEDIEIVNNPDVEYPDSQAISVLEPAKIKVVKRNNISSEYVDYVQKMDKDLITSVQESKGVSLKMLAEHGGNYTLLSSSNFDVAPLLNSDSLNQEQYQILVGTMPQHDNEMVMVVDSYNRMTQPLAKIFGIEKGTFDANQIVGKTVKLLSNNDYYQANAFGLYPEANPKQYADLYNSGNVKTLKISGVMRRSKESTVALYEPGLYYKEDLTKSYLQDTLNSNVVKAQKEVGAAYSVVTGESFEGTHGNNGEANAAYEMALTQLGGTDKATKISIIPKNFEAKDAIKKYLDSYNTDKAVKDQVQYTDMSQIMVGVMDDVIKTISIVLIGFSSISLIVSSLMIGIITYVSVIERTKEIGVLRSLGARKKDISRVFNAETFLIGLSSGVFGVAVTYMLQIPINAIIHSFTKESNIASLQPLHALILIAISIGLTFIAGLIPSRIAAKKDPVVALRSE